jgi:hypothetical protein
VERKRGRIRRVKYWATALAILTALSATLALAEDFKTINGKEYKDASVSRVERDGIVLKTKSGIAKVYFVELPKEIQQRFGYNPARAASAPNELRQPPLAPTAQQKMVVAREDTRKTNERSREEAARLAKDNSNAFIGSLFGAVLVFAIVVVLLVAILVTIVAVANANARKQKRALIVKQAQEFVENVKQKLALPVVPTDIMLKPDETAFYSSPSALHETRAVREYHSAHAGARVAKGVYIGGTSGRSLSTQQWAKLDTGRLTITNKRLVFVGKKEQRAVSLDKVISVDPNLTAVVVSVEGRQKAMAFEAANPLIAMTIIRIAPNPIVKSNIPTLT